MKTTPVEWIELRMDEWEVILERAKAGPLNEAQREKLKAVGESYIYLLKLLEDKSTTIDRLRKLLVGPGSEKTRNVIEISPDTGEAPSIPAGGPEGSAPATPTADSPEEPAAPPRGHGRNSADDYAGAEKIQVPHATLRPSDPCPQCREGTVYEFSPPGVLVRITGQAPVQAKVYELQKLRCNRCGRVFTADAPPGVGLEKYDLTAASMIGLLKYGTGMPFNRLEGLQGSLGLPLPAATQWDIVQEAAALIEPAHEELVRQAAQGEVLYNDDTTIKILDLMGKRAEQAAPVAGAQVGEDGDEVDPERRGMFTSGIVSTRQGRQMALFFSGRRHAGENLAEVLRRRASELGPPIQMCDGLSRNLPGASKTILGNCLAHGRRKFVEVIKPFPVECRHVLGELRAVYRNDALTGQQKLSPADRLAFHQAHSGPVMERFRMWLTRQIEERLVEPNSSLGQAISYLLKHWEPLTLFLRQPGAPLDNNICERALKLAIRNRRNALFYKTLTGAHVGDAFMSLIHTCRLNDADPFDYLTELQKHAGELALDPEKWMPWNYRETLAGNGAAPTPVS